MTKHASRPYNPNVAYVFYLAGYIESWGRGIEKICQSCEEERLPKPIFSVTPGDVMVEFSAPEDSIVKINGANDPELSLITLLKEDPGYTVTQLAEKLALSRKTISKYLQILKKKKIIERVGARRIGYWKIIAADNEKKDN